MNKVLNGLNFTLAYLDDVIIFRGTPEQHLKHIQIVLTRLKQANLKLKKSKCVFIKQELHYLGHLLTTDGIKPWNEKVKAISEMKPPTNQKRSQRIFQHGRKLQEVQKQTELIRKECKFEWSEDCQSGFEYLKTCLTESTILRYPNHQKRYGVFTDASDQAAAAVLTQEYNIDGEIKKCLEVSW